MMHQHIAFACLFSLLFAAGVMLFAPDLIPHKVVEPEIDVTNETIHHVLHVSSALRRAQATTGNDIQLWPVGRGGFQHPNIHPWQCGVQGAHRILHTMKEGSVDSFTSMYQRVGSATFRIRWNPCKDLTRFASCNVDYEIPDAKIAVGRIPSDYARVFSSKYSSASSTLSLTRTRLEDLIRQKKPVIVNLFQGAQKAIDLSVEIPWPSNKKVSLTLHIPLFHYVVVFGFDDTNVHFYDTDSDERSITSWSNFMNGWNWRSCSWNEGTNCAPYDSSVGSVVKAAVEGAGGLTRGAAWWFDTPIYPPTPGCNCDCCGVSGFCLVPCGCKCKIPETRLFRIKVKNECGINDVWAALHYMTLSPEFYNSNYENSWDEGVWETKGLYRISPGQTATIARTQNVNLYFHAHDKITGAEWGNGRKFDLDGTTYEFSSRKIEASLGTSYLYSFTCDTSTYPPPSVRLEVMNGCPYAGRIWVLVRRIINGEWRFASASLEYGESKILAKSGHKTMYYYAQSYDQSDIEWGSSDEAYTYNGKAYNMRGYVFSEFGQKTLSLTCSNCTPRDCEWSSWSSWGDCKSSADKTLCVQKKNRFKKTTENYCGLPCEGLPEDVRSCQCQATSNPPPQPKPTPRRNPPTPRPPTPRPPTAKHGPAPGDNAQYKCNFNYLCRTSSGGKGSEPNHFEVIKPITKDECEEDCSREYWCRGYEFRYKQFACELWNSSLQNKEYSPGGDPKYCCFKSSNGPAPSPPVPSGNGGWTKNTNTACGFGGEGDEGDDFLKWYNVRKEWCEAKCLDMGSSCLGRDYDSDKNRCRVFKRLPTHTIEMSEVDCWLKQAAPNTVVSPNRVSGGNCASRDERSQNCGAGPSQPVSCCEPDRGCEDKRCK